MESFRKAYGALKDSTTVGLAKVSSEYKDLDIAIVKATNHVEYPPKERHIRKIFTATSVIRPRADIAYCIHALSRRLEKTRNWIVAIKVLVVIHRTLNEGDSTFKVDLLSYSNRGHFLDISNFKDDSSLHALDCSAWVRTYALFLEEKLECLRILKYDIETEHFTKVLPRGTKLHSRTRILSSEELLQQLPALQQLLYRLFSCQPEGAAFTNYLVQYALALVLKESFKIYCSINDGIINLVDLFFDMSRHDAIKALNIYKRAGHQAEFLADFYEFCKGLDLARTIQFPTLKQPPPSFLATMEEYIRESTQVPSSVSRKANHPENESQQQKQEEPTTSDSIEEAEEMEEMTEPLDITKDSEEESEIQYPPSISVTSTADLLGLNEVNPRAAELEESNALALAIISPGTESQSTNQGLNEFDASDSTGWELALVTAPSNNTNSITQSKMVGGFDKLLLDSLYEDDTARRHLQLQNAGYGYGYGASNPFEQPDPFMMSRTVLPSSDVQMSMMSHQQQQQMMLQQQMMMVPYQSGSFNPFGDPFSNDSQSGASSRGSHSLL